MRRVAVPSADRKLLKKLTSAVSGKLGLSPLWVDMRGLSPWMDYFLVISGTSAPHRGALRDAVLDTARALGQPRPSAEGAPDDDWQILRMGFVVVHVQSPEARVFYDLDGLWGDAPRIKV